MAKKKAQYPKGLFIVRVESRDEAYFEVYENIGEIPGELDGEIVAKYGLEDQRQLHVLREW